jgi:hypothetical protein
VGYRNVSTDAEKPFGDLLEIWNGFTSDGLLCRWDMLDFEARDLYVLLSRIIKVCTSMAWQQVAMQRGDSPTPLVVSFLSGPSRSRPRIAVFFTPEQGRELIQQILEPLERHCHELALDSAQDQIDRIRKLVVNGGSCGECVRLFEDLYSRILGQLKRRSFFHLPGDKSPYYKADKLFGPEVDAKFPDPDAREDLSEAGNCFAVDRFTACVFHLMRVMERGVRDFGARLGIPEKITHQKEWGRILNAADGKIKNLAFKTARSRKKRQAYSELWALLDRVREAWRNPTMHPKASYTEAEAKDIIDSVKAFMTRLAKLV